MLMIIMHNRRDYLENLLSLMQKENITDATIIEKEGIGVALFGDRDSPIMHRGNYSNEYNLGLLAIIRDIEKAKHLLEIMDNDPTLRDLNFDDQGYICTVPFQQVRSLELEASSVKKGALNEKFGKFFTPDRIILDLKAQNKEEAIKEIAALLRESEEINNFDVFVKEIFEREKLASTCIGNGIALPHARSDTVENFVIAFGRSKEGIDFNSLDDQLINLIFVLGTPKRRGLNTYLKILAHLSRVLQKPAFRNLLLTASRANDIIDEFNRISGDALYNDG
ncbi:MAG: PTS sugar transporter subunit IIA [bacterium]